MDGYVFEMGMWNSVNVQSSIVNINLYFLKFKKGKFRFWSKIQINELSALRILVLNSILKLNLPQKNFIKIQKLYFQNLFSACKNPNQLVTTTFTEHLSMDG